MDFKKKQKGMVFHQEGASTPVASPAGDHHPAHFAVLKPGKASEGGMEQSARVTNEEAAMMGKPNMYPSKEAIRTFGGLPATKHPVGPNAQSENLSPDSICKGIRVTLDNNNMWNEFFRCKTEMILTKQGSRMFPYCRFRISGLQPSRKYSLIMDIQPLDNSCHKWTGKSWQVAGKAECHVKSQPFSHPQSPSTGQQWMQNPVSFFKLKLTSNVADQEGNTILNSMHRYIPRLHVVQTEKAAKDIKLNGPNVFTFTFPQTEFMAVTAYMNSRFAQLKIDYNPFTKGLKEDGFTSSGLKLKLNSGKDLHKDGGMTANEQHPLKKSLKSLLANHKPRSSKALDSKPLVSDDLQKKSSTSNDQSTAKVTEECSGNSLPAQKLFSELIRDAHVSLQRCNLEQLGDSNSTSHRTERINIKTNASKNNTPDIPKRENVPVNTSSQTCSAKKSETVVARVKCKENCKDIARTDSSEINNVAPSAGSQNSSADSNGHQHTSEAQSEIKAKQHKRPAPLPLPALALFLKQHSSKSKKVKSKPDSPPAPPLKCPSEVQSSVVCLPSVHTTNATGCLKDLADDVTKSHNHTSGQTDLHLDLDEMGCSFNGQSSSHSCPDEFGTTVPKRPRTDGFLDSIPVDDGTPDSAVSEGTPVLPSSDQPFCTLRTSISKVSSTLATSSPPHILSPHFDTVLSTPNSQHTPTINESCTLPSDSHTMKTESLLPDPQCSSFDFETLSPASPAIPLPSLPPSLTLEFNSASSEPSHNAMHPEEMPSADNSSSSVFKWHTVLPPPERYIDDSFTTFQPPPQNLPLVPDMSQLLPLQSPSHPEPQNFHTSTSTPSSDLAPSFQENEQSLPFPAELSPLALQLSLSPTFSSLDGGALSPAPSLTDLVHFFSADDLEMGEDFSNTETVAAPCPPPSIVEGNTHEISQQVVSIPATKPCKRTKRTSRKQTYRKTDIHKKVDATTYSQMQPNLEEVEEQLFISFTSKEALELHVVDSPEEVLSQPETTPEGDLQPTTCAPENDKSMDVGGSLLPDSIHPNNFPAKMWRLVNNPENNAICWNGRGNVIVIDKYLCERQILSPNANNSDNDVFKTTNFSSFVRQLNLYGFRKVEPAIKDDQQPAGDSGTYRHFCNPNFKRNHPELVANMRRLTVNNKAKLQAGLNVGCRTARQNQRQAGGHDGRDKNVKREETAGSWEETIDAFEKILLRDLKLMKHRQAIHPVLQEVGLKMNLLDPSLAIDLQYLGVHLPIPPPGASPAPQAQELAPSQVVCAAFVSRTGKTMDVTQIKGWREKFTPSEAPPTPAPPKPEAGPSSDLPKKNLSAFCSDMLDEYLENEGKLIDERAASFSQPVVEPVAYQLPTRSTSYVRTLDNILKKPSDGSPTADLISGFVPPSKRPKLTTKATRTSRRENKRQKGPKLNKPRVEPAAAPSPGESTQVSRQPAVQDPDSLSPEPPGIKRRKKLKPKILSQTLSPTKARPSTDMSGDMAPLESDSELATGNDQSVETHRKVRGHVMTRALLKQKDLEDGVVWEGKHRTAVTEERASIALTSLFTLMGFVSENPTAPIQLMRRQAPPCLNDFCRLGCICTSLAYCSRVSHCGRPACMLGCSCLKQKVVLLKNLDGSDSSTSQHGHGKKRRRKRRMKMAYILKEADSVSQPAERVRTLWRKDADLDPICVPQLAVLTSPAERGDDRSSCARVRGYRGRKRVCKKKRELLKDVKSEQTQQKSVKKRRRKLKETKANPPGESVKPSPSNKTPNREAKPPPKPSKHLVILAECNWSNDESQGKVLKVLCERMAQDKLDKPFWISNYLIRLVSQTMEEGGTNPRMQYKVHISCPRVEAEKSAGAALSPKRKRRQTKPEQDHQLQVAKEAEPLNNWHQKVEDDEAAPFEDWQREVEEEEAEPPEEWQRQVEDEEAEPPEDWQREVEEEEAEPPEDEQREAEESDIKEAAASAVGQVHGGREEGSRGFLKKRKMAGMALPFLTGISPAGFLSAKTKEPGGTDHRVRVNGKLYPLAKIQLGKMGALHPANRLAAYLTGRVGSNNKQQALSSSSSLLSPPKPPQNQTSPKTAAPPRKSKPVNISPSSKAAQPAASTIHQSAASADKPAAEAPEGAGSRVVMVKVIPFPRGEANQIRVVRQATGSSAPKPAAQVSKPVAPKGPQLVMVPVSAPPGNAPVRGPAPGPAPSVSTGQRLVLQHVKPGVQYYRKPNGTLVQLVPISHLRSVKPNQPVQSGSSSTSAPPAASRQTQVLTVVHPTPPGTAVTTTPVSSLSHHPPLTAPPLPPTLLPAAGVPAQRGMCTFKILPTDISKEPIIISCPKLPTSGGGAVVKPPGPAKAPPNPPVTSMNLMPLKPSTSQVAEPQIETVTVSPAPMNPGGVLVASIQRPAETSDKPPPPAPAPPGSEVTPPPPPVPPADGIIPEPELARDLVDRDIICVDNELGLTTMETVGGAKRPSELNASLSSETENSSDFGEEDDDEGKKLTVADKREMKDPRAKLQQLFRGLRREAGLSETISKVGTLQGAAKVIQELTVTGKDLHKRKRRLRKRRDDLLNALVPSTEGSRNRHGSPESHTESADEEQEVEVVDLTDQSDDLVENSSDEEDVVSRRLLHNTMERIHRAKLQDLFRDLRREVGLHEKSSKLSTLQQAMKVIQELTAADTVLKKKKKRLRKRKDDFLNAIAPATEEGGRASRTRHRSADTDTGSEDADPEVAELINHFKGKSWSEETFRKAQQELEALQSEAERLKSMKTSLSQQRDAYVRHISRQSGKSEQRILRKLRHLLSKQKKVEKLKRSANQLLAAGGDRGSDAAAGGVIDDHNDVIITSSSTERQMAPAPPTPVSAPPTTTAVQPPVQTPHQTCAQQPQANSQSVPHLATPTPPSLGVTHNASVVWDRPRTVPNILSRVKKSAATSPHKTTGEESSSFQAVVPAEVLSLVGTALPGQQVVSLSSLMAGQMLLQTSPTPGLSSVTLNIPSLTNQQIHLTALTQPPTAQNFSNLLQLVQPQPPQQEQRVPAGQPAPPPPPLVVKSDRIKDQDQPPSRTDATPESPESPPSTRGPPSPPCPEARTHLPAEVPDHWPLGPEQQSESREDPDNESLTSLLNEIVFLNQQTVPAGPRQDDPANSPWLLQLDSDSDDLADPQAAGLDEQVETTQAKPPPGPANGNATGGILAPPPLLQMKVGGAKVVDPASRPMPRLVPLGLRGNPHS